MHHQLLGTHNGSEFRISQTLVLLLHGAVLLGFALILSRLPQPYAIFSWLSALPIAGVFLALSFGIFSGRVAAHLSVLIFFAAMVPPAVHLADALLLGFVAFATSFIGILLFGEGGASAAHFWYPIACLLGAFANLSFFVGFIAMLRKSMSTARWAATVAYAASLLVTFALAKSTELHGLYLGHGLWVASFFSFSLGIWQMSKATSS